MANQDIRDYAKERNICLWQIADALKVSEATISRKLRKELDENSKKILIEVIDKLSLL